MHAQPSRRGRIVRATILLAALASPAMGDGLPWPNQSESVGREIRFDGFVDDAGHRFSGDAADMRPWIVCPIYTRCPTTCSALTAALKTSLASSELRSSEYRVLVLSFDAQESDASLADFRARMRLPSDWTVVRAENGAALERVLRALDFRTIELDDGRIEHPNLVAVLDAQQRVSGYVYGLTLPPSELTRAVHTARDGDATADLLRSYPIAAAAIGLLASATIFLAAIRRGRRQPHAGCAPERDASV